MEEQNNNASELCVRISCRCGASVTACVSISGNCHRSLFGPVGMGLSDIVIDEPLSVGYVVCLLGGLVCAVHSCTSRFFKYDPLFILCFLFTQWDFGGSYNP